jgi:Raf kinase inhibitor-like YbhB/YbcL family protein
MNAIHSQSIGHLPGLCAAVMLAAFSSAAIQAQAAQPRNSAMKLSITSTAFTEGQAIPAKHTCQGDDVSPPLQWTGAPASTKSLALVCDDPDAPSGIWVHWVIYNLPATAAGLPEKVAATDTLSDGSLQGTNDFKRTGYGGPCPPPGKAHRYFFKLYALDAMLTLKPRATKQDLLAAMKGHIVAEGQLMGTYQRR